MIESEFEIVPGTITQGGEVNSAMLPTKPGDIKPRGRVDKVISKGQDPNGNPVQQVVYAQGGRPPKI